MNKETIDKLYAPFKLKERPGSGGMKFKYVPSDDVIDRMNRVFNGQWSTTIIHEEKHEDMVVVRVRVCVIDPDSEEYREYCHDGYGSSSVARFSGGQNKGQAIDMGNAYKSAESKAIRNACTRFGVGLYLEGGPESYTATTPTPRVTPTPPVAPSVAVPVPPVSVPVPPVEPPVAPVAPVVPTTAPVVPLTSKPVAKPSPFPQTPAPAASPKAKEVVQDVSAPAPKIAKKEGGPSDVQKAALSGMVVLTGLTLTQLLTEAFESEGLDTGNVPDSIDSLDYNQAVVAIKYGSTYKK